MSEAEYVDYGYPSCSESWSDSYLFPTVERLIERLRPARLLEVGCGNGSTANRLARRGDLVIVTGKCDAHFNPLWDGGHIKFWSERSLKFLLQERGFSAEQFFRCGRISPLAKSMIVHARQASG